MTDYRVVKTRWYHRVWEYFFRSGEPSGFEIGWLVCKLYLNGKPGNLFRVKPGLPQRIVNEFNKEERATQKSKAILSEYDGKRKKMHEKQKSHAISVLEPLEYDPIRSTKRGMGRLP